MKILFCGDVHWSVYSSIIRSRSNLFSTRLTNLIQTINWVESQASSNHCDLIIYLGDFFDSENLTSEEVSALSLLRLCSDIKRVFIVGNHELGRNDLSMNSANVFSQYLNCEVISEYKYLDTGSTRIHYLPYILSINRNPLESYLEKGSNKNIIVSHNDIAGIQLGKFISLDGFSIEEIESNCDLFINGHLHNGSWVTRKILNLGNITGLNFSEDAFKYSHKIMILDTDSLNNYMIENPYAFNFYKLDFVDSPVRLDNLKSNAVCTIRCNLNNLDQIKELIKNSPNIIESRILVDRSSIENTVHSEYTVTQLLHEDHLLKFQTFILDKLGSDDLIKSELEQVIK